MENLLEETKKHILASNHLETDVMFVGSDDGEYRISFEDFTKISDFLYDEGYGSQEIAPDLIVYFNDGSYLRREEYDGAEWWEYMHPHRFSKEDTYQTFNKVKKGNLLFGSIKDLNEEDEDDDTEEEKL